MIYLSQLLGNPVYDCNGEKIGQVNDLGIATGEVFPRVTSLAIKGPGKTPFMVSWRKYVGTFSEDEIRLKVIATDIRFSYLQPNELLIARDLLDKQIVDVRGMRVVRVNDLKLSDTSSTQLRLLGAEVGIRGILRTLSPHLERLVLRAAKAFGKALPERIIAWNYMDLLDRDLSNVKLSVSHKTLEDMHPADIADIIEKLDPRLRGRVFAQLDDEQAADAMAEIDEDKAAEIMEDLDEKSASRMLSQMDPDDAAELVSELDYDKAEKLLNLMGINEQKAVRLLLGYRENTAGRIMTSEFVSLAENLRAADAVSLLRTLDEDFETVYYIYLTDEKEKTLTGIVTLNKLIVADPSTKLLDLAHTELVVASPDDDQEDVAKNIAKYNLLAMPVVDDKGKLLGIITVDDALDVLEDEHEEDLQLAGALRSEGTDSKAGHSLALVLSREMWFFFWLIGTLVVALIAGARFGGFAELGTFGGLAVLAAALALPIALLLAEDAAGYAVNYFVEYDPEDEDSPSLAGFSFKGAALGILSAALVAALSLALFGSFVPNILGDAQTGTAMQMTSVGIRLSAVAFATAAICVFISFALAPLYLFILRKRDMGGHDLSGIRLSAIAMTLCLLAFVGLFCFVALPALGV